MFSGGRQNWEEVVIWVLVASREGDGCWLPQLRMFGVQGDGIWVLNVMLSWPAPSSSCSLARSKTELGPLDTNP